MPFFLPVKEKWSLHSFLTTAPQQADVADNILLLFYKKKTKQNKKNNLKTWKSPHFFKTQAKPLACSKTTKPNERVEWIEKDIYIYVKAIEREIREPC